MRSDLKELYKHDGFVIIDFGFPKTLIEEVVSFTASYNRWCEPAQKIYERRGAYEWGRVQDAWKFNRAVKELAMYPTILEFLEDFYGKYPKPFQTLNFPIGTEQAIHSDVVHFNCWPNNGMMCGVWVALEDVDENNGPLIYYPGSHQLPELFHVNFNIPTSNSQCRYYDQYEKKLSEFIALLKLEPKRACLKKGEAVIWAANLLHGGDKIKDKTRTRFSQATHYFFEDSQFYWTPFLSDFIKGKIFKREPEFIR